MFKIDTNGIMTLSRGDDVTFLLNIFYNDITIKNYLMSNTPCDNIIFTVISPNTCIDNASITKIIPYEDGLVRDNNNPIIIKLDSKDTINMLPGKYYYQVKMSYKDGSVDTIIKATEFILLK